MPPGQAHGWFPASADTVTAKMGGALELRGSRRRGRCSRVNLILAAVGGRGVLACGHRPLLGAAQGVERLPFFGRQQLKHAFCEVVASKGETDAGVRPPGPRVCDGRGVRRASCIVRRVWCVGSHKERFDEDGQGKGAAGRVQNTGGVHDLSQVANRNKAHADVRGMMC